MADMKKTNALLAAVKKGNFHTVILAFPDMQGRWIGKRMTARFFAQSVAAHGTHACAYLLTVEPTKPTTSPKLNSSQLILISIIAITALILLNQVRTLYSADRLYTAGKSARQSKNYQTAIEKLQLAVKNIPSEPLYTDELALTASEIAAGLVKSENPAQASEAAAIAIVAKESEKMGLKTVLMDNEVHVVDKGGNVTNLKKEILKMISA